MKGEIMKNVSEQTVRYLDQLEKASSFEELAAIGADIQEAYNISLSKDAPGLLMADRFEEAHLCHQYWIKWIELAINKEVDHAEQVAESNT
jgi:hypothetical protein